MPQATLILKPEFAEAVREALGGRSISQAAYKTGISYEWLRKMVQYGHVPSEAIVEKLAVGLSADLQKLRIAAGYAMPANPVIAVEISLRGSGKLSEEGIAEVLRFTEEVWEREVTQERRTLLANHNTTEPTII